jgi:hypothetical protein
MPTGFFGENAKISHMCDIFSGVPEKPKRRIAATLHGMGHMVISGQGLRQTIAWLCHALPGEHTHAPPDGVLVVLEQ